ncbi:MAG: 6,7-dimethyl-8-ribityllumazine synthase [Myxococcota bacterium]
MARYEGRFVAHPGDRFAIVAARFNHLVVDRLVEGAIDALVRHGVARDAIDLVHVPGAWELSWAAQRLVRGEPKHAAVVALGAVIRGATPHFDYVAGEAARGAATAQASGVPVVFGVLTTDTIEQAFERAGTKAGNKGFEAAMAALEVVDLGRALEADGL